MAYDLFLFDADDTLFDFRASERAAFAELMKDLAPPDRLTELFATYRLESERVWRMLELGQISKDDLKSERFRRTFAQHAIEFDPVRAGELYLEALAESDLLIDQAFEVCEALATVGEIGILTNGFMNVQRSRVARSKIAPFISFVAVSEECGFPKPDKRFFEFGVKLAKRFAPLSTLMIGDRLETDIAGAHAFGVDACFYNPGRLANASVWKPKYEIAHLSELRAIAGPDEL